MEITLAELGKQFELKVIGDGSTLIQGIAALDEAKPHHLSFLFNSKYRKTLAESKAGAVVVAPEHVSLLQGPGLVSNQPRLTWAEIAGLFDKSERWHGIHPTAVIDPAAEVGADVTVGPHAVVRAGAVVGEGASLGPGTVVGEGARVGAHSQLHANVVLYHEVQLGARCIVHAGAIVGADGFGYEFDAKSASLQRIPQVYSVWIADDVDIGAGTTIDRGALTHTEIGQGVKIDNQVQIGHGVKIGPHTAISGATAIAGSTRIGAYCLIGGAVGIVDQLTICDQVEISAMSLVTQSIETPGRYSSGTGLMPGKQWRRNVAVFKRLEDVYRRLRRLESNPTRDSD